MKKINNKECDSAFDPDFCKWQSKEISSRMNHLLELIDEELGADEVHPSKRPLEAIIRLYQEGLIEVSHGDMRVDIDALPKCLDSLWFRVLYAGVEYWYENRFGAAAIAAQGTSPLEGAVMIRGVPFLLRVPTNRSVVHEEGETAWMYFEEEIGEGEQAEEWVVDGPDLSKLSEPERENLISEAERVASVLRFIEFRRVVPHEKYDEEVQKLISVTLTYVQEAARRMVSARQGERGPAWFDLQMVCESALKAVIRRQTGRQPHSHDLSGLLEKAMRFGVVFDDTRLSSWPKFTDISEWRYAQGSPPGLKDQYLSYCIALDIARAAMENIPTEIKPGFGVLLKYAPWKMNTAKRQSEIGNDPGPYNKC